MEIINNRELRLFKNLNHSIAVQIDYFFSEDNLTAAQCDVLLFLFDNTETNCISSTEIHQNLGISRADVSILIKKLTQKGYITLKTSPMDKRQKQLMLTEKAILMQQSIEEKFEEFRSCLYRDFTKEEYNELQILTFKMLQNLKEWNTDKNKDSKKNIQS